MKRLVIEIPEPGDEQHERCGFDVVDEQGRRALGLNFDEMLGQVVSLTHPKLDGSPQYRMQTDEEWAAERARTEARIAARRAGAARANAKQSEFDDIPF